MQSVFIFTLSLNFCFSGTLYTYFFFFYVKKIESTNFILSKAYKIDVTLQMKLEQRIYYPILYCILSADQSKS